MLRRLTVLSGIFALLGLLAINVPHAHAATIVSSAHVEVRESAYDVDTGLTIKYGDTVEFSCSGSIWAGVWFTGRNGPEGWSNITYDPKFPLTGTHPFKQLGKLNGRYFSIGKGITRTHYNSDSRLYLRINDDAPGNGDGSFFCDVWVYR